MSSGDFSREPSCSSHLALGSASCRGSIVSHLDVTDTELQEIIHSLWIRRRSSAVAWIGSASARSCAAASFVWIGGIVHCIMFLLSGRDEWTGLCTSASGASGIKGAGWRGVFHIENSQLVLYRVYFQQVEVATSLWFKAVCVRHMRSLSHTVNTVTFALASFTHMILNLALELK